MDRNTWIVVPAEQRDAIPRHFELLEVDGHAFARCSDGRFANDRCLVSDHEFVLLMDGVILNKKELHQKTGHASLITLVGGMFREKGIDATLASLRGVFSGILLDRKTRVLHGFANQTGESAAFEYYGAQGPILSSSFDLLMRVLLSIGAPVNFDEHAAMVMLSYGFMIDNHTFAREIKRVGPGEIVSISAGKESKSRPYWQLAIDGPPPVATIEEAVIELDRLFRRSVKRCFDKDSEYGYKRHLVDVSAGMDSRMVNIVARDLGYAPVTNVTYSESGSDESRYAIQLASRLGNDCVYLPLDRGRSLLDPEENLRLNSGMAYYAGSTGAKGILRALNFDEFGLETTGIIGDSVLATFVRSTERRPPAPGTGGMGSYSRLDPYPSKIKVPDEELFFMNTNAFRGMASSALLRQHFTVAVTPYSDIDLLEFIFLLPLEWRINYKLYSLWIRRCYPWALEVPTTNYRLPFRTNPLGQLRALSKRAATVATGAARRRLERFNVPGPFMSALSVKSMNPFDTWFASNPEVRRVVAESMGRVVTLSLGDELDRSLERSFAGAAIDRLLAVTVVTMHSMYFTETQE